jgi:uncharacterized protein
MNNFDKNSILTYSGKMISVTNPKADDLFIEDIAHALANQCRFGGHSYEHLSVAEHSINCALEFKHSRALAFTALMHDSAEAYLTDLPTPIKSLLPDYLKLEDNFNKVLAQRFGFEYPFPQKILDVDKQMLNKEMRANVIGFKSKSDNIKKKFLLLYMELKPKHQIIIK